MKNLRKMPILSDFANILAKVDNFDKICQFFFQKSAKFANIAIFFANFRFQKLSNLANIVFIPD